MIRIRDIALRPGEGETQLLQAAAKILKCPVRDILRYQIFRRSIDARKKQDVRIVFTLDVAVRGSEEERIRRAKNPKVNLAGYHPHAFPTPASIPVERPVVVGFGPGGMFAALVLAEAGLRPIVLERGQDADTRQKKVKTFWEGGALDSECNVQFGEGGAGTFSDGKLHSGIHDRRAGYIFERMVEFGAPESILYDAKPHIGTDILIEVVKGLRRRILELGGSIEFGAKLTGIQQKDSALSSISWEKDGAPRTTLCRRLILAIGHSARDTFRMLLDAGVPMEPKPFSMGVRIEHRQSAVNESQYGPFATHPALPPADYKLNCRFADGSSAYTFCMCPGGYVVAAASECGGVVTNGMSYSGRGGKNANAALLVTLTPRDFPEKGPLGGIMWQEALEKQAFRAGGSNYHAPAQRVGDFLAGRPTAAFGAVKPTYRPGVTPCDLHDVLPRRITDTLEKAIPALDRQLAGFADPDAVLTAPETRSSSPVRILRDETMQSAIRGLYPCAEGAGYAGGITSSAVDGIKCAESLILSLP